MIQPNFVPQKESHQNRSLAHVLILLFSNLYFSTFFVNKKFDLMKKRSQNSFATK